MRASRAGVSVVASWPACRLNSPASRSSRNRLLQRMINASLQSSLSRIAAQVWFAASNNINRARRASSARPLRLAARWLSSKRSESDSTMVLSMDTIILPFQLLQYTSTWLHRRRSARVSLLDFEYDRENQRSLGGLFVDVALEIDADFFFDHRPVRALFRIGCVDSTQNDVARASDQVVAVVAHEAARDDFRLGFEFAAVLVDGDDRDHDTVFGKMPAITNDHFLDFLERTGIHQHTPRGDGIAAKHSFFRKFDAVTVFGKQDFAADDSQLMRERRV